MFKCCGAPSKSKAGETDIAILERMKTALPGADTHKISQLKGFAPFGTPEYEQALKEPWQEFIVDGKPTKPKAVGMAGSNGHFEPVKPAFWAQVGDDVKPAAFVVCFSPEDVQIAVDYAAQHLQPKWWEDSFGSTVAKVSVCCGRHSDCALVDGGLVIDVSGMNKIVEVDEYYETITVQAGCLTGNVLGAVKKFNEKREWHFAKKAIDNEGTPTDEETQQSTNAGLTFDYAILSGNAFDVGVAGHLLTGGFGHLYREFGGMCDSAVQYKVVLADGTLVTATEDINKDLFKGLKGGGGNFGVLVEATLKMVKLPRKVFGGQRVSFPLGFMGQPSRAKLLQNHADFFSGIDSGVVSYCVSAWGGPVVEIYSNVKADKGDPSVSDKEVNKSLFDFTQTKSKSWAKVPPATLETDSIKYFDFMAQQQGPPWGKTLGHDMWVKELTPEVVDVIARFTGNYGIPKTAMFKGSGNACILYNATKPVAGGFGFEGRESRATPAGFTDGWLVVFVAEVQDKAWMQAFFGEMKQFRVGQYAPHAHRDAGITNEEFEAMNFGENWSEMKSLKRKFDSKNLFQVNNNIKPDW